MLYYYNNTDEKLTEVTAEPIRLPVVNPTGDTPKVVLASPAMGTHESEII